MVEGHRFDQMHIEPGGAASPSRLLVAVACNSHQPQITPLRQLAKGACGIPTVHARQPQVQEYQLWSKIKDLGDRVFPPVYDAHLVAHSPEEQCHGLGDGRIVLHHQDARLRSRRGPPRGAGGHGDIGNRTQG